MDVIIARRVNLGTKTSSDLALDVCENWKWKSLSYVQLFVTPWTPWNSPGQNIGVGSLSLLQGIFPTQGSNPDPSHYRQILYLLSHSRSPRILEWVAYPFSSVSSWPRNQTRVSCIEGRFFTNWVIGEATMDMSLSKLQGTVKDWEASCANSPWGLKALDQLSEQERKR